jgi:uncharacterized protein (DUF305 family)
MHSIKITAAAMVLVLAGLGVAVGQDSDGTTLPAVCTTDAGKMAAAAMPSMAPDHSMDVDEGHMSMMSGMDAMNKNMMMGGMAKDIDVAFACAMIPHHQGALDMAKAELEYGDDEWAKVKAQQVIDAQVKEIAELKAWLEKQPAQ